MHLDTGRFFRSICLPIYSIAIFAFLVSCNLPAPIAQVNLPEQSQMPADMPAAQQYFIILPDGTTPTPFLPLPVTGTPPPTSTPLPTPLPSPTPTATPWLQPTFAPPSIDVYGIPAPMPMLSPPQHINFLLLGSDSRGGASFRTDVVMVAMVDRAEKSVTLISIPRDLYVYIPGWTMNRINTAYLHGKTTGYPGGGNALIKDTIRYNLGLRIDHVALVDFNGFRKIIDTAGGINVPLVCPFKEWAVIDPNVSIEYESNWELITIGPGMVHMDGETALWYARARARSNDFDRGRRQQEVIRALFNTALENNLIPKAPQLYEDFKETVTTDVELQTILSLVPMGLDLNQAKIRSFYIGDDLTWGWRTTGGASVLLPDREKIYAMLLEAVAPFEEEELNSPIVSIWNWSDQKDWEYLAAERLHYAGYETLISPPVVNHARKTVLYDYTPGQSQLISATLLKLLGLSKDRLINDPQTNPEVAFRLVIGNDYDPCFNPTTQR